MAELTKARFIALFQILEVPMVSKAHVIAEPGLLVSETDYTTDAFSARTKIEAYLTANIYTDAAVQAVLEALLDEWIALGTANTRIEGGSVGAISGLSDVPNEQRNEIRARVTVMVPFFRSHLDLRSGASYPRSAIITGNA